MKLPPDPQLPLDQANMRLRITSLFRDFAKQVNMLTEGRISANHAAMASVPTAGMYAQGDFVENSAPSELGSVGSKYIVLGWKCTVGGDPATFVQVRALTGN